MRTTSREAIIYITTPAAPPAWALLERELLRQQSDACAVSLAPGAGCRLAVKLRRYANQPSFAFPWT